MNARALHCVWWLHPAVLFGGTVLTLAIAVGTSDWGFQLYSTRKYLEPLHLAMGFAAWGIFAVGVWLAMSSGREPQGAAKRLDGALVPWFWLSFLLTLAGYGIWLLVGLKNGFSLATIRDLLQGADAAREFQQWLEALGRFSIADAVHVTIVCAEALKHAHAQNMVHRDIKPDNILVTKKGVVKVADFGLAKVLDEDVSMTQSGTGLGTPLYMAPEQARSAKYVDQRCDIYALGATLYHMLTGKLPYTGNTALELIIAKEKGIYPNARKVCAEVSERLDLIVDKMMAKEPSHRYKSCDEVIRDLFSLGVHSESLSFIGGAIDAPGNAITGGATQLNSLGPAASTLSPTQTATPARKTPAATELIGGDTPGSSTRIWYVQFEDAKGKTVVEKHSTGRILKMLAAGQLTAKARTKASADGSYFPLSQFPEFTKAVEDSLVRRTAGIRKEDMGNLYKKVEKDQKSFQGRRKMKDFFRNAFGIIKLILLVAAMGAAVWFVVPYLKDIPGQVAEKVGLGEKAPTTESPSADSPTGTNATSPVP